LRTRVAADPVYAEGLKFFNTRPVWGGMGSGYGQHVANALQAHRYVKQHVQDYDQGYRVPPAKYWNKFGEAFYVMDEERRELNRVAADAAGLARLQRVARFTATKDIRDTYAKLIEEFNVVGDAGKFARQKQELNLIATQEQINILQPLIYEDAKLISTMNINHTISRYLGEFFTPKYKVVYSAQPSNNDSNLQTVFDDPSGVLDYFKGPSLSLPNPEDRMKYVAQIARDFNRLMGARRAYMEAELQKIRGWLNA
jgi:DNA-binding transcriptional regulator/RsmH inhibitor MraZ